MAPNFFIGLILTTIIFINFSAKASQPETATKLPEVVVNGERSQALDPDEKIGSYNQPRWTAHRAFSNTRTYVLPDGDVEAEFWVTEKVDRATRSRYWLIQKEVEVGLGSGLQLDIYQNDQKDNSSRNLQFEGMQYELRWALEKWGALLFNPTLYFEYHSREVDPDKFEFRLLLGEDFSGWRVSSNLAYETELWMPKTREMAVTLGVAHKLTNAIMVGVESKAEGSDTEANRGNLAWEYYMGPSIRWNPTHRTNLILTSLIGVNDNSHLSESTMIFGVNF